VLAQGMQHLGDGSITTQDLTGMRH